MFDRAFVEKHRDELTSYRDYYRDELLEDIVPFWAARVPDPEFGGFFSCFDREGVRTKDIKPGWFVGRNIYTFANLCNAIEPCKAWLDLAQGGVQWMFRFGHQGGGRFNSLMARDGSVLDSSRSIFNDAFSIKGYYEYLVALGDRRTDEQLCLATEMTDAMFRNSEDVDLLASEGISPEFRSHPVNFMMLLCAMEGKHLFGTRYRSVLDARLERAMYAFASDEYEAVFENLGPDFRPKPVGRGRLMDPGHALESCWFSMREGMERMDRNYIKRAGDVIDWILKKGWDAQNGGFILLCDAEGGAPEPEHRTENYCGTTVNWDDKVWWAQAEGLNALAMSALLNGSERHFAYFRQLHDFVDASFRDRKNGEWYAILRRDNTVLRSDKGMENKGPYHVTRCVALLYSLLRDVL